MKIFEKTGKDKLLHLIAGAVVGVFGAWLSLYLINKNQWHSGFVFVPFLQIALGAAFWAAIAGVLKEFVRDAGLKKGTFDLKDIWWTIAGGFIVGIVFWVFVSVNGMVYNPVKEPSVEDSKYRIEHIHDNDPASFRDSVLIKRSDELKQRADSLTKIMYEKSKRE